MKPAVISLVVPCFNNGREALAAVAAVHRLARPDNHGLEAIVVDDASTDGSASLLESGLPGRGRVVRSPRNLGRGGAINLGAEAAIGQWLLVLDADCIPTASDFLLSHLRRLTEGVDVSVGDVHGHSSGFWGRYQSAAGKRRARIATAGSVHGLTTANMMLHAATFHDMGGFDVRYSHYGFEDRDFLLRLRGAGFRIRHTPDAAVTHAANLDMPGICRKMRESGSHSAALFRARHPHAYRELGYAAIDATLHPRRAALLAPFVRLALTRTERIEAWLQREYWPYRLRAAVARAVTAAAYLDGTRAIGPASLRG